MARTCRLSRCTRRLESNKKRAMTYVTHIVFWVIVLIAVTGLICVVVNITLPKSIALFHRGVAYEPLGASIAKTRSVPFVEDIPISNAANDEKLWDVAPGDVFRFKIGLSRKNSFPCCWPFVGSLLAISQRFSTREVLGKLALQIRLSIQRFLIGGKHSNDDIESRSLAEIPHRDFGMEKWVRFFAQMYYTIRAGPTELWSSVELGQNQRLVQSHPSALVNFQGVDLSTPLAESNSSIEDCCCDPHSSDNFFPKRSGPILAVLGFLGIIWGLWNIMDERRLKTSIPIFFLGIVMLFCGVLLL